MRVTTGGGAKVTVTFVKRKIVKAMAFSDSLVERRLGDAGLRWLRRRRKSLFPTVHKLPRITFGKWVLAGTAATLSRWAYTDGTVYNAAGSS